MPTFMCQSPIGQMIGLEAQTVWCTWQPEANGLNSTDATKFPEFRGVEGTYLLQTFPVMKRGETLNAAPFAPIADYFQSCRTALYTKYSSGVNPEDRLRAEWWEDWFINIAPMTDDVTEYLNGKKRSKPVVPMKTYIFGPVPDDGALQWEINKDVYKVVDPTFGYPQRLAVAMNSVYTERNKNALQPRLVIHSELAETVGIIYASFTRYYNEMKLTNESLKDILKRCVTYSGTAFSFSSTTKPQFLSKLVEKHLAVYQNLSSGLSESDSNFLSGELRNVEMHISSNDTILYSIDGVHATKSVILEFLRDHPIQTGGMQMLIALARKRDSRIVLCHRNVYHTSANYINITYKPSIFAVDNNNADGIACIPAFGELNLYHRVYWVFKDVINSSWKLVVLCPATKSFQYYDPLYISGSTGQVENQIHLTEVTDKINKTIDLRKDAANIIEEGLWTGIAVNNSSCCSLTCHVDSGVYVYSLIIFLMFQCPPIISENNIQSWRRLFIYWIINGQIPDLY